MSDPIYHPKFLEFLKLSKDKEVSVDTNGHGKSFGFWFEAFQYNNVTWRFGLDGLPEESHKYRINQDGNLVYEVMKMGASMGANINWNYIVFRYNENNINIAKDMAKENGIKFNLIQSSRWKENDEYKPTKFYLEDKRSLI
jgi:MoaA/NifB/PqqE/SkfB family radical SAM enzyme